MFAMTTTAAAPSERGAGVWDIASDNTPQTTTDTTSDTTSDTTPDATPNAPRQPVSAPTEDANGAKDTSCTIRAAVSEFPPYATMQSAGVWGGDAVDLFRATARDMGCEVEFINLSPPEVLRALERKEIDAVAMALTPNPLTASIMTLTPSFATSHISIAVFHDNLKGDLEVLLSSLTTPRQLRVYAVMTGLVLLFALLIWVLEHSKNQHFRGKRHEGIGSGLWWSITTLSTVGYGDKVPVSGLGRFFAATWMVLSLLLVAIFTATVTSSITAHDTSVEVHGVHDLPRARVGVVEYGLAAGYVNDHFLPHVSYPHLSLAIDDLRAGSLDAVLADKHSLDRQLASVSDDRLTLLSKPVSKSPISFGFRRTFSRDLMRRFDAALVARLTAQQHSAERSDLDARNSPGTSPADRGSSNPAAK